MDELLRHLDGADLSVGQMALVWVVGIAAGVGVAALLLLAIV